MNPKILEIFEDEFDDVEKDDTVDEDILDTEWVENFFYRNYRRGKVLDLGCGGGYFFDHLPITHALEPNVKRMKRAMNRRIIEYTDYGEKESRTVYVLQGFAEEIQIPFSSNIFNTVFSWGTMCFVRSMMEVLCSVNKALVMGGRFIFDVNTFSTMPIVQTVHPECFIRYVDLFGFKLIERREFGIHYHNRVALAVEKYEEFNPKRFHMLQCVSMSGVTEYHIAVV